MNEPSDAVLNNSNLSIYVSHECCKTRLRFFDTLLRWKKGGWDESKRRVACKQDRKTKFLAIHSTICDLSCRNKIQWKPPGGADYRKNVIWTWTRQHYLFYQQHLVKWMFWCSWTFFYDCILSTCYSCKWIWGLSSLEIRITRIPLWFLLRNNIQTSDTHSTIMAPVTFHSANSYLPN